MKINQTKQLLREYGLNITKNNIRLLEFIRKYEHLDYYTLLSMMQTYDSNLTEFEYNAIMQKFKKHKIIKIITFHDDFFVDAKLYPHGHLKCDNCGRIVNVKLHDNIFAYLKNHNSDYKFRESKMLFFGLCDKCKRGRRK